MQEQLELFPLAPRDEGRQKVDWCKGGISSLELSRFKRFSKFEIDFGRLTLLVGTNSSGKTSILQAIRLFFWCIKSCLHKDRDGYVFRKAVIPFSDFHLIPSHTLRELSFRGISPNRRTLGTVLKGTLASGLVLSFRIYASYSTLMVVDPEEQPKTPLSDEEVANIDRPPLYIPGFFGVVTRELLAHDARLEELLNSGHHNEVLRNIILRLKTNKSEGRLQHLVEIMSREFQISAVDLPFSEKTTEFLKAEYSEPGVRIPLDFVSAGSGFLQVLQIMAHALQNPSPILLLDEPDAHMHHALQKSFLGTLRRFANEEDLQVVMASHSETFIRETPLEEIRVVEPTMTRAACLPSTMELQDRLSEHGVWPTQVELTGILRTRRVLILESEEDSVCLDRIGRLLCSDWDSKSKQLQVIYSDGSDDNTVRRLEFVRDILARVIPEGIQIAHMRDRDLLCDEARRSLTTEAVQKRLPLEISDRRNRESILIEPSLMERAVRHRCGQSLPDALVEPKTVENLVVGEILAWCNDNLDEVPVKIQEYNRSWLRRTHEADNLRDGERVIASFIRSSWHEPIGRHEIPWKLVDGKAVLRRVRKRLQEHQVTLPEVAIFDVMTVDDFDACMTNTVKLITNWFEGGVVSGAGKSGA
jgi:predicted ATPase